MIRLLLALFLVLSPLVAAAETRLALVIGNSDYDVVPLANPARDAQLMSEALAGAGFDVQTVIDANQVSMKQQVRAFATRLNRAGPDAVATFYYAGHGVQVEGKNYLVPVDATIQSVTDLEYETVDAQWVLDTIGETRANISIIILDACRNNPFRSLSRSLTRGLARMDAPRGALLSYSTAPGDVASDGEGLNSPYTEALAKAIRQPGLRIEDTFKTVRRSVLAATGQRQLPWESTSLVGDFYFTPADGSDAGSSGGGAASVVNLTPATVPANQPTTAPSASEARQPTVAATPSAIDMHPEMGRVYTAETEVELVTFTVNVRFRLEREDNETARLSGFYRTVNGIRHQSECSVPLSGPFECLFFAMQTNTLVKGALPNLTIVDREVTFW